MPTEFQVTGGLVSQESLTEIFTFLQWIVTFSVIPRHPCNTKGLSARVLHVFIYSTKTISDQAVFRWAQRGTVAAFWDQKLLCVKNGSACKVNVMWPGVLGLGLDDQNWAVSTEHFACSGHKYTYNMLSTYWSKGPKDLKLTDTIAAHHLH